MIDIKITRLGTDNSISLATGNSPFKVSGINKLIQQIVKMILTTPGTDMWNPGIGAGVKRILTMNSSNENAKFVCGQIAISIKDTEGYMLQEQIGIILDDDEALKALDLVRCYYDSSNDRWQIILNVTTRSDRSSVVNIF